MVVDVLPNARLMKEEIFGPVAPLTRFSTEEDVIRMSNDSEFGLASYIYTKNANRAWAVVEALEAGMVGNQRRSYLNRSSSIWRCQAIRARQGRLKVEDRRISRHQIPLFWKLINAELGGIANIIDS